MTRLRSAQEVAADSPQAKKAAIVESYMRSFQAAGVSADAREIEAMVVADCQLVDAAGVATATRGERKPAPARTAPAEHVAAEAERNGLRATVGPGKVVKVRALDGDPRAVSERWALAAYRIAQIIQGAAAGTTLGNTGGAAVPALAREYFETWSYFTTRHAPQRQLGRVDHNPFRGMSDADAARKFMRLCEDICDRSTGRFGQWQVPK